MHSIDYRWAPLSRVAWPPSPFGDGATTTTVTTNGQLLANLRLHHHPLSTYPALQPYNTLYSIPVLHPALAPTAAPVLVTEEKEKKMKKVKDQSPKKAPESTTSASNSEANNFNQGQPKAKANEKLVQGGFSDSFRALPFANKLTLPSSILPPKFRNKPQLNQFLSRPQGLRGNQLPPRFTAVDYKLVTVYQKPNYKYIIDKITQIPGELLAKIVSKERLIKSHFSPAPPPSPRPEKLAYYRYGPPPPQPPMKFLSLPFNQYLPPVETTTTTTTTTTESPIKVEAIGDVDTEFPLPNGENVILLQPSARAVSGKDGTSIANPISRVVLRKNRPKPTTILYRPQAVAISGPGGTSHAQAELIIDYVDDEW